MDIYHYFISYVYSKEQNGPIDFGNLIYDSYSRLLSSEIIEAIEGELKMDKAYSSVTIVSIQILSAEK